MGRPKRSGRLRFALPRGPENELAPAGPLAHPLLAAWLDPVDLIAVLDLEAQGTGIYPVRDRKALILKASLRDLWRADSVGLLPWEYVGYSEPTSYEIWVDHESGLALQLTAIQDGQAFYQFQVTDLVFDLEFPAGYFEFDPPESALPKLEFTFQGQRQPPGSRFREAGSE